ncbi:MAG: TolC family protein, partial [Acidobacteriota bacterium]|nr:TolC family protein [Acidobacteriota bacterium]
AVEAANERAQAARYSQVVQDLNADVAKARAILNGSRRIAQNTPVQLEAARATEQQATARYKAGLGNIAEVAEAQRLLTQAEIDDSLARLAVWRALLGVAAAQGDLTGFLAQAGR